MRSRWDRVGKPRDHFWASYTQRLRRWANGEVKRAEGGKKRPRREGAFGKELLHLNREQEEEQGHRGGVPGKEGGSQETGVVSSSREWATKPNTPESAMK